MNTTRRKLKMNHWQLLVEHEPGLVHLLATARAVKPGDDPHFCANEVWYGYGRHRGNGIKGKLVELVGFHRHGHRILGTQQAYDTAYKVIYEALPDCRDCSCWRL